MSTAPEEGLLFANKRPLTGYFRQRQRQPSRSGGLGGFWGCGGLGIGVFGTAAGSGALVVRVIDLTLPPERPADGELATVVVAGGKAQVWPAVLTADGETPYTITLECYGTDSDNDGIPDAVAAALGDRLTEGVKLLTIQYADGRITATTPFVDILVVEGIPMPLDTLPATWRLVPDGK